MSPTRKPRPPDKGAPPEHKPSRKVALEEVMHTLQDLVNNELATRPEKPAGAAQVAATKPKETAARADVLPTAPPAVAEPASEPESGAPDRRPPTQSAGDGVPPGGLQQELPYLEAAPVAPSAHPPAPEARADAAAAPTAGEINWDDIPVLVEAVELAEQNDIDAAGHDDTGDDEALPHREQAVHAEPDDLSAAVDFVPPAASLPPADAAHRLAVQVAARLNLELRKSGQGGLNSDVITQLARLLEEALAKAAPNMENAPSDKH